MKSMPETAVGHQLVRQNVVDGGHPNHLMWHVAFACLDATIFRHPSARISADPDGKEICLDGVDSPGLAYLYGV